MRDTKNSKKPIVANGELTCGARTRRGTPCKRTYLLRGGRCPIHGGLSTGPRTPEGLARALQALRMAHADPEIAKRVSEKRQALWRDPGYRLRITEMLRTRLQRLLAQAEQDDLEQFRLDLWQVRRARMSFAEQERRADVRARRIKSLRTTVSRLGMIRPDGIV